MKQILLFALFLFVQLTWAQDKPKFAVSEFKIVDTLLPEVKGKYTASLEYADNDKKIFFLCEFEKPLRQYYEENGWSQENVLPAFVVYDNGNEQLFTLLEQGVNYEDARVTHLFFNPSDNTSPLWQYYLAEEPEMREDVRESYTVDLVLVNKKKKDIVYLLASKEIYVRMTKAGMENIQAVKAKTKVSAKKLLTSGVQSMGYATGNQIKETREKFLESVRPEYLKYNASVQNTLKGKKVVSISINIPETEKFEHFKTRKNLEITATLEDGKKIETKGISGLNANWEEYIITAEGIKLEKGVLKTAVSLDELIKSKHQAKLTITPVHHPHLKKEFAFNYTYGGSRDFWFYGESGVNANLESHWPRGGYAPKGEDGADGRDGGNGQEGPELEVFVDLVKDPVLNKDMLKCKLISTQDEYNETIYVDVNGGKVTIASAGGRGGDGQRGQDGADSNPCSGYYQSGDGGKGGNGGNGGNGGKVTMYITTKASKYQNLIVLQSPAGAGGSGGYGGSAGGAITSSSCPNSTTGSSGQRGADGYKGYPGPKPVVKVVATLPAN